MRSIPLSPPLRSGGYNEIQRIIREVDPPRPSTRLTKLGAGANEVARRRSVELGSLTRQLKSELEWIPLKAMRKERGQRYASPSELAEDLQNYLNNRPLRAGPETTGYRAKKFLRRNKTGVAASAAMFLLLVSGIIATTWQAIRATRAERVAIKEKSEAKTASENLAEVNKFLTEDLLASAAPEISLGKEMTVREAVDRAADTVATRFNGRPEIEGTVRLVLAQTYYALGYTERALPHAQTAADLFRRARGDDDKDTINAAVEYAHELVALNRSPEAEPILRDQLARARRTLGAEHRTSVGIMSILAWSLRQQGQHAEAEAMYREVLAKHQKMFGRETEQVAMSTGNVGISLIQQGKLVEAEPLMVEGLRIRLKIHPPDHPDVLTSQTNLARLYEDQGRMVEAEKLHRAVLVQKRRVLKDDHPNTTTSMLSLAAVLADLNRYDEAIALTKEALAIRQRISGPDHLDTLLAANNLAAIYNRQGKAAEAEPILRDVVERRRRVLGEMHAYTVASTYGLLRALVAQHKDQETDALLDALEPKAAFDTLYPEQQALVLYQRGVRMIQQNKPADAEQLLRDAIERLRKADPPDPAAIARVQDRLGDVYESIGRPSEAATVRAEAKATRATTAPATNPASQPAR
ncbi:MAG: tetratricopeptide repeat protein [Anaerolineae bacterium]|nr:tetratricopeptide repeat protein [Phycisphaerae bacterium]